MWEQREKRVRERGDCHAGKHQGDVRTAQEQDDGRGHESTPCPHAEKVVQGEHEARTTDKELALSQQKKKQKRRGP